MIFLSRFFVCCAYLVSLCLCSGCNPISVHYDFDQNAAFQGIRTYGWTEIQIPGDALQANPLLKKRIVEGVNTYMQGRGYILADTPDVYLAVQAGFENKMQVIDWGGPHGFYMYPWPRSYYYRDRVDIHYYTEGTLIIDIIRAADSELIWRGEGIRMSRKYDDQEKMQHFIDEYVAEILNHFPPGHEK
ncbi:DUF4136 domain-containing protein [Desulfogranum japonicum]|uniref:DUF4136 domain-containing protein n=1 Tax=Desulfogranum japonicum TaxID=231447 RepID=UPI0003F86B7A|nr:DUF4136 domain-containing protein [Desulfogranum japonicum]